MKYNMALPFFAEEDIAVILEQYRVILSGEGTMTMGPFVCEFEQTFARYVGTEYSVATNSCTSALEIALRTVGVGLGDEVVIPCQTFFATGAAVAKAGATPVCCEISRDFLLDFKHLQKIVTPKTKAVILVHFAGLIHAEVFEMRDWLQERGIALIEDCAHAHGASIDGVNAGNIGVIGCYSFYSTKIMTMGEGGALTVNNQKYFETASSLRSRGDDATAKGETFIYFSGNHRVTEFQALLGLHQLKRLGEFNAKRNWLADLYKEELGDLAQSGRIRFQEVGDRRHHAYWRFIVFLETPDTPRGQIRERLNSVGIAVDWAYDPLVHLQPAFQKAHGYKRGDLPFSEALADTHFCLPMHVGLREEDIKYIAGQVKLALS